MRRLLVCSLVMSSLILGISKAQAVTINVDTFNQIDTTPIPTDCYRSSFGDIFMDVDQSNSPFSCSESGLSETITTTRKSTVIYGGSEDGYTEVRIQPLSPVGSLFVDNLDGGNSSVKVEWQGSEGLNLSNLQDFTVGLLGVDNPNAITTNIRLEVKGGGNTSFAQTSVIPNNQPQPLTFSRGSFSDPNIFNNMVDSIAMILTGDAGYLIRLDYINYITVTSTPEPSLPIGFVFLVGLEITISYLKKKHQ